jgi:hypothetical protein
LLLRFFEPALASVELDFASFGFSRCRRPLTDKVIALGLKLDALRVQQLLRLGNLKPLRFQVGLQTLELGGVLG